jgi:hypothetical protein
MTYQEKVKHNRAISKPTGNKQTVSDYKATFCPDTLLLRSLTPRAHADSKEMFIATRHEENMDVYRHLIHQIPCDTLMGWFVMLSLCDDDGVDVPIRRIAFAYLARFLGIGRLDPVQYYSLPLYSTYSGRVKALLADLAGRDPGLERFYDQYKADVLETVSLDRSKGGLSVIVEAQESLFGLKDPKKPPPPAALGVADSWLPGESIFSTADSTVRSRTVSTNYFKISMDNSDDASSSSPPAAAPPSPRSLLTGQHPETASVVGVQSPSEVPPIHEQHEQGQGREHNNVPDQATIDELNALALRCLGDQTWLSNSNSRCMVLLFATTVLNGARDPASWPSSHELSARKAAVMDIIGSKVI